MRSAALILALVGIGSASVATAQSTPPPAPRQPLSQPQPGTTDADTTSPGASPPVSQQQQQQQQQQQGPPLITAQGIVSTWWNWTRFIEREDGVRLTFGPGQAPTASVNATNATAPQFGVVVRDERRHQSMLGVGMGITDASSIVLADLKASRPEVYDEVLQMLFNPDPAWVVERGGIGANLVRFPMGACDFGYQEYTYDDTADGTPDVNLTLFNMDKAPKMWATLSDVRAKQPDLKLFPAPWSPPAWVKGNFNSSLRGGSVLQKYEDAYARYFLRTLQGLDQKGLRPYILSLQNEPLYSPPNYPGNLMQPEQQARLGTAVRRLLDANGFKDVKLGSYDHNWDGKQYPVDVFDAAREAFAAVLWHCYGDASPSAQAVFSDAYAGVETHMTECTQITQYFNEPWANLVKQMERLVFGSVRYGSQSLILWNGVLLANADGFTQPHLPNVCLNCLAPILVWPNASTTGELPQGDGPGLGRRATPTLLTQKRPAFVRHHGDAALHRRQQNSQPQPQPQPQAGLAQDAQGPLPQSAVVSEEDRKAEEHRLEQEQLKLQQQIPQPLKQQQSQQSTSPGGAVKDASNGGVKATSLASNGVSQAQAGASISPNRDYYKLTSDFAVLHHFSRAIRPAKKGGPYATLVGTTTTEDNTRYPRVYAQTYRLDDANAAGDTRFTMLLFQRNDHYRTGLFEDATMAIQFRNHTTNVTLPPGVYNIEWYAPRSSPLALN